MDVYIDMYMYAKIFFQNYLNHLAVTVVTNWGLKFTYAKILSRVILFAWTWLFVKRDVIIPCIQTTDK